MRLSARLNQDHESGDFGMALDGYADKARRMEALVEAVAHIGVDFGYGEFELDEGHIKEARDILGVLNGD